ncbi:MAG: mitochondrial 37S ribosomal protein nam9 [Thelocarpon impressellum]|nr:MAG: mitochondrial 37S ribosomal protein nam9 [Thelocarpon impressellum]
MRRKFHGLKRIKVRQSWNKFNLYNLAQAKPQQVEWKTYFQQKWQAKSTSRAYHGEQIREKQWQRMFRPHMASVVPMNHAYLSRSDGSELAAGRGSGLDVAGKKRVISRTPYMNMTYAPIERRLDTAIFRALFASSTRQARQFVVHGAVKVNGKKMIYPGYLLNPGDMFQVEPDRVLYATGAPKDRTERRVGRIIRGRSESPKNGVPAETEAAETEGQPNEQARASETAAITATEEGGDEAVDVPPSSKGQGNAPSTPQETLTRLLSRARSIFDGSKDVLPGKRKKDLRAFQRTVRRAMGRASATETADLDAELTNLISNLSLSATTEAGSVTGIPDLSQEDQRAMRAALREARDNPVDASKPYATPWRPREYMSAFAFIPRFLEVNQKVCSAVYLRHPVARPGLAEVPSPFHTDTHQLAFNWYLRRR